jgi:hypothetical protein
VSITEKAQRPSAGGALAPTPRAVLPGRARQRGAAVAVPHLPLFCFLHEAHGTRKGVGLGSIAASFARCSRGSAFTLVDGPPSAPPSPALVAFFCCAPCPEHTTHSELGRRPLVRRSNPVERRGEVSTAHLPPSRLLRIYVLAP